VNRFPDYLEPIVAWRGWTVDAYGGLCGSAHRELWMPGERYRAICKQQLCGHPQWDVPVWRCSCGIYAYKTLKSELEVVMGSAEMQWGSPRTSYCEQALGQVNLWGRILVGKLGYRAQFAYPKAIIVSEELGADRIKTLRKEYRIEVQTVPNIGEFLMQQVRNYAKGEG
jgi:hypothetical protein